MFYGFNTISKTEIFPKKPHTKGMIEFETTSRKRDVFRNCKLVWNLVCVECEICVVSGAATLVCNVYHENLISSVGDGFLLASRSFHLFLPGGRLLNPLQPIYSRFIKANLRRSFVSLRLPFTNSRLSVSRKI